MVAPRLLSRLLAAILTSCTAAVVGLTPGRVELDLVFPLNDTYAPPDGPLPIVFALSSQAFQPALVSTLQLHLTYLLLDIHNGSNRLAYDNLDLGKLSSSSADNPYFLTAYSDKLAGRETQFELQCYVSSLVGLTFTEKNSTGENEQTTMVTNPNVLFTTSFTTQNGAQAADVPSRASNGSTCLPHGGWSMVFDVSDYIEIKSETYAVMAPDSPSATQLPCAAEVDAATAASITAGTATAATAGSSSSDDAASTAVTLSDSGTVTAFWSILILGLSAVLLVC